MSHPQAPTRLAPRPASTLQTTSVPRSFCEPGRSLWAARHRVQPALEARGWAMWSQKIGLGTSTLLNQLQALRCHWTSCHCSSSDTREIFPRSKHKLVPKLCWRHSSQLAWGTGFLLAGCQGEQCGSLPHVALLSPGRYRDRAQQAACAGGFLLSLWRTNKRQGKKESLETS